MNTNKLYPVFLKLDQFNILIIGGGFVAEEKLQFMLKSSPNARVKLVASFFREGTVDLARRYDIECITKHYEPTDLINQQLVIVATDNESLNEEIYHSCKKREILVNVADNPPLCDFYMGGIVTKGDVKIAISTNGKSPTMAKRIRQLLEIVIPDDVNQLVNNLDEYRKTLKGDFEEKMKKLNDLTKSMIS